jgi:4-amino-4-deoxy-L-arabinose transferase-like glycosyltransferase
MAGLIAGFVFFSLSRSKVAAYVAPLAPLAAILVTWELGREIEAPHRHTWGPALLSATEAACAVLLGLLGLSRLEGESAVVALAGAAIFAVGALVSGFGVVKRRPRWVYGSAAGSSALFLLAAVLFLYPSLGKTRSTAELIETVPLLSTERPLVTVEVRVPSLTFYLDRIPEIVEMEQLEERLARDDSPIFLFVDVDLPSVPTSVMERLREVGRQGKYIVFEKKGAS